LKFV
jgi:ABC-type multidrug transport system fused ATPase/permease subunit